MPKQRRGQMKRLPSPKKRLRPLFRLLGEVATAVDKALCTTPMPADGALKNLTLFDISVLMRGNNALKSIRILCEEAHWEMASGIARQIFEFVLNMEYLASQPDREKQTFLYAKFGLLQHVRTEQKLMCYAKETGRPYDEERLFLINNFIEDDFDEFRSNRGKLWNSWSGKTTRQLAELSKNGLRASEYDMLFTKWSEEAHGVPASLLSSLFHQQIKVDELVASDYQEIAQLITLALRFFLELWMLLPHGPRIDGSTLLEWTTQLSQLTATDDTSSESSVKT